MIYYIKAEQCGLPKENKLIRFEFLLDAESVEDAKEIAVSGYGIFNTNCIKECREAGINDFKMLLADKLHLVEREKVLRPANAEEIATRDKVRKAKHYVNKG